MKFNTFNFLVDSKPNELESFVKNASDKELIKLINFKYKDDLLAIARSVIVKVPFVPIDSFDLYNDTLPLLTQTIRVFEANRHKSFSAFLTKTAKYIFCNQIQFWLRKKRIHNSLMIPNEELHYIADKSIQNKFDNYISYIDTSNFLKNLSSGDIGKLRMILIDSQFDNNRVTQQKLNHYRQDIYSKINNWFSYE